MSKPKPLLQPIRFGEFLHEQELLSDDELLSVLADHWSNGGRVGKAVSRQGLLSEHQVECQARLYHELNVVEIRA